MSRALVLRLEHPPRELCAPVVQLTALGTSTVRSEYSDFAGWREGTGRSRKEGQLAVRPADRPALLPAAEHTGEVSDVSRSVSDLLAFLDGRFGDEVCFRAWARLAAGL